MPNGRHTDGAQIICIQFGQNFGVDVVVAEHRGIALQPDLAKP